MAIIVHVQAHVLVHVYVQTLCLLHTSAGLTSGVTSQDVLEGTLSPIAGEYGLIIIGNLSSPIAWKVSLTA